MSSWLGRKLVHVLVSRLSHSTRPAAAHPERSRHVKQSEEDIINTGKPGTTVIPVTPGMSSLVTGCMISKVLTHTQHDAMDIGRGKSHAQQYTTTLLRFIYTV